MSEQISAMLKKTLDDLGQYGEIDAETRRNALKEDLQFYVLNFIYHHPEYNTWTMYGGSALRIIHRLDRMSVDLDFEIPHAITQRFLEELKKEVENHFTNTYGAEADFLTIKITPGRGLILKFHVGEELSSGHRSKQVHVKIDLNHFVAPRKVRERWPINRNQLSFVIVTYNLSALMASKLAAIFLRGTRGVGGATYEEKGRDIYDLLWYMNKKIVPDLDYLVAKGIDAKDPRALFDKLTLRMDKVSDENLKQDLAPLFVNRGFIENWLINWRESYLRLLDNYKIHTVTTRGGIRISQDFHADIFSFIFSYDTVEKEKVSVVYKMVYEWLIYEDLSGEVEEDIVSGVDLGVSNEREIAQLKQYVTLFLHKTENYFKKTNGVMLGDTIITKVMRNTADNLNQKEQIVLNKSALLSCELDDLLK